MKSKFKVIPGVNIQWPWSEYLLGGRKTIETRSYPLPEKLLGIELAVIETPGRHGKKDAGIDKARIVGTITFKSQHKYKSREHWRSDQALHQVPDDDPQFQYLRSKPKWGWTVGQVNKFDDPLPVPPKRGIIFAKKCKVWA